MLPTDSWTGMEGEEEGGMMTAEAKQKHEDIWRVFKINLSAIAFTAFQFTFLNYSRLHKMDSSQIEFRQKMCSGTASNIKTTKLCLTYGNRLQLIQSQTSCRHLHTPWIHSCLLTANAYYNQTSETDPK